MTGKALYLCLLQTTLAWVQILSLTKYAQSVHHVLRSNVVHDSDMIYAKPKSSLMHVKWTCRLVTITSPSCDLHDKCQNSCNNGM